MDQSFSELRAKTQRNRIDFLNTDLDLCSTFVDVANTELHSMNDHPAAIRAIGNAEEAHATVSRLLLKVDDGPERDMIQQRLTELRIRMDRFQKQFHF